MKFTDKVLVKVETVKIGDTVVFDMPSANYTVLDVEVTAIGMIRHQHEMGSSSYWPGELVYIQKTTFERN